MWWSRSGRAWLTILMLVVVARIPHVGAEDPAALVARGDSAFNRGDLGEAIALFRDAAMQGHAPAQSRLAYVLDKAEENEEAVQWYRKAAEQGDAQGQFGLGQMISSGEGVERDTALGLTWIRRAADQGLLVAIVASARLFESAQLKSLRDEKAAYELWLRAANMGDHSAMMRVVAVLRQGELGQSVDEAQAKEWEGRLRRATQAAPATRRKEK